MIAMKFGWPEKIAALAALLAAILMSLLWLFLAGGAGSPVDLRLDRDALYWSIEVEAMLVLPLWLLLRAMYFAKVYWSEWWTRRSRITARLWRVGDRLFNRRRAS